MKKFISFLAKNHIFANFFFIFVFIAGVWAWQKTPKEELPNFAFDSVVIFSNYAGATATDIEQLVTRPIEEKINGIEGIESVYSVSNEGSSSIYVELERHLTNKASVISDISNAVLAASLPSDMKENPLVKERKTTNKDVINIAFYLDNQSSLNSKERKYLQQYSHALENQFLLDEHVYEVRVSGYRDKEIKVEVDPYKLKEKHISLNELTSELQQSNLRQPAGSLENYDETKLTFDGELDDVDLIKQVSLRGVFEAEDLLLGDVAYVYEDFAESNHIYRINGHEGIILKVVKKSSADIMETVASIRQLTTDFEQTTLASTNVKIAIMDDESVSVRERLLLIKNNAIIGFLLIVIMLFIFLSFKASFWVAMGIPFTFCLTMFIAHLAGFTINNMTLASVIIVMGMIVDDAIVVVENIERLRSQGMEYKLAAVEGTSRVILPIIASVLTTFVAFLPLSFMQSFFTDSIAPIVGIMLLASLIEAIFILPAHMNLQIPRRLQIIFSCGLILLIEKKQQKKGEPVKPREKVIFQKIENYYAKILDYLLNYQILVFLFFIIFSLFATYHFKENLNFVLFPREESTELFFSALAPEGISRQETAKRAEKIEAVLQPYLGKEIEAFETTIGMRRFGQTGKQNELHGRIYLVNSELRSKSSRQIGKELTAKMKKVQGFSEIDFGRKRFGSEHGVPLEILLSANDYLTLEKASSSLIKLMNETGKFKDAETDEPAKKPEYKIIPNRAKMKEYNVSLASLGSTLRSAITGNNVFKYLDGDEEVYIKILLPANQRKTLKQVLNLQVPNSAGALIPIKNLVKIEKENLPTSIVRENSRRVMNIYADIIPEKDLVSPNDFAKYLESEIFPQLKSTYPGIGLQFEGEVRNTRESGHDFVFSILLILLLIYFILALLFNSMWQPFNIMLLIPLTAATTVYVYLLHGYSQFGFFGAVGVLGLFGVVINDSIVMLVSLRNLKLAQKTRQERHQAIAKTSSSRLRAVTLTTLTTVAGLFPTAYGWAGYDSMLSEMMLVLAWGLLIGSLITLVFTPSLFCFEIDVKYDGIKKSLVNSFHKKTK